MGAVISANATVISCNSSSSVILLELNPLAFILIFLSLVISVTCSIKFLINYLRGFYGS